MPALSGCIEDQELSSFKDDMLADVMELKVEKADDNVQYKTGCYETNACKWKQINATVYFNFNLQINKYMFEIICPSYVLLCTVCTLISIVDPDDEDAVHPDQPPVDAEGDLRHHHPQESRVQPF